MLGYYFMDPDIDVYQTEQPQISYSIDFKAEQSSAIGHWIPKSIRSVGSGVRRVFICTLHRRAERTRAEQTFFYMLGQDGVNYYMY